MSLTKRKDGRYCKKITIDGKSKYFYSKADTAHKAELDINKQILVYQDKGYQKKHNFLQLAEAMLEEKEKTVGYKTYVCYCTSLKHMSLFYDKDIRDITAAMLQNLINQLHQQKYGLSTIRKVKVVYGLIANYAIMQGVNVSNFSSAIKLPKSTSKTTISAATDNDISIILKSAQPQNFSLWPLILLYTGMRRGELAAIRRKDIDFDNETIHIWRSVEYVHSKAVLKEIPKSISGIRTVPILEPLKEPLKQHCQNMSPDTFIFGGDSPWSETIIRRRWKNYCTKNNLDLHQHQLRHTYAKILYRAGVDPKTAQGLLGHSDIQTTMNIYTEFSEDVTLKSVNKINQFLSETSF